MPPSYTVHVISHTHWDREWYLPFSGFRPKLVKTIDSLLHILNDDPEYIFHLDGQTRIAEDYLEARPHNADVMRRHIRAGRIIIGPWYVQPDEFLPSPEALYRNLRLGIKRGSDYGPVMKVGYLPDPFGQIGQMWQLLARFGIRWAVVRRGMPLPPEAVRSEVRLLSPDGSVVLGAYLVHGYTNARALGVPNRAIAWLAQRFDPIFKRSVFLRHNPDGLRDWLFLVLSFPLVYRLTHLLVSIEDAGRRPRFIEEEARSLAKFTQTRHLLFMNGGDHRPPRRDVRRVLTQARDGLTLRQGTLEDYFTAISEEISGLPEIRGEMRGSRYFSLLPGVLSTRMYLKQINHEVETLAERWAYPWAALAQVASGKTYPSQELDGASRTLILNHAHDSICGTSVDQVHRDMRQRFRQAVAVFRKVTVSSQEAVAQQVDTSSIAGGEAGVLVFNPSLRARTGIVTLPDVGFGRVLDHTGDIVACQFDGKELLFQAAIVPALGYRLFRLAGAAPSQADAPIASGNRMENEHLVVDLNPDGSFNVRHKASGHCFEGLGVFEDGSDAGDTYNYAPPEHDRAITSRGSRAEIALMANGALEASYRVRTSLAVPAKLDVRARRRVGRTKIVITSWISLRAGARYVTIRTEVDNRASDHRLRVLFPSGIDTGVCHADGHWEVVERPLAPEVPPDSESLTRSGKDFGGGVGLEKPASTSHQRRFVDVNNGRVGLAVLNRGLPEYEVMADSQRTVALTLLRCVGWLSRSTLATRRGFAGPVMRVPEAQCRGKQMFDYAVYPHQGNWKEGGVHLEAEEYDLPLRYPMVDAHGGTLPPQHGFLSLSPDSLVMTGLEWEDGSLLLRLYNVDGAAVTGQIRCGLPVNRAAILDFNGALLAELLVSNGIVAFQARGHEMMMIRLTPE